MNARVCRRCGADITDRNIRARVCLECARTRRVKPCQRCGGPKGDNLRQGSRLCAACQEIIDSADHTRALDRERNRRARIAEIQAGKRAAKRVAPPGQKWCARCQRFLPLTSFGIAGIKLNAYCIPCAREYNHQRMLAREYGITPERYEELFELQDGRCAICLTRPRNRRLSVDHDHKTGEIRGLLCTRCNHGILGKAHDSAAMLHRAVLYLTHPPAQTGQPITEHNEAQADLEFLEEQLPFLQDGQPARHPTRDLIAITGATFLALTQAAGYALLVDGQQFDPPPQLAIDDMQLLTHLATT